MSHGDSSSSLSDERQKGAGGVLAWLSVPIDYFLSFFPAPSEAKTRPTASSAHWPGEEGGAGPSRRLFESASQFRDRFEEQFLLLAASAGLPAEGASAEHSVHGIYVPPNVEDWTAFAASLPDTAYPRYKMILPKKTKILALDLDETLVHSTSKSSSECDFFVEVFVDRSSCLYYVFKRPYVDHFLDTVRADAAAWSALGQLVVPSGDIHGEPERVRGSGGELARSRPWPVQEAPLPHRTATPLASKSRADVGVRGKDGCLCKEHEPGGR